MKTTINSIPEAREELKRLSDSISQLEQFFGEIEGAMVKFGASPSQVKKHSANGNSLADDDEPVSDVSHLPFTDRILIIIRDFKNLAVSPKAIVIEYEKRHWPKPEKVKLYSAVFGAISYLYNKKRLIERTPEGAYKLAAKPISGNRETARTHEVVRT